MANDIFDALMKDHEMLLQRIDTLEQTHARGSARRQQLARELALALIAHNRAESSVFYAGLQGYTTTELVAETRHDEHEFVNDLARNLADLSGRDPAWEVALAEIKEVVVRHMQQEEAEFFPRARAILSQEHAQGMARCFEYDRAEIAASA